MEGNGQFDHAEIRPEVAAGLADLVDQECPDLGAELLQFVGGEVPQILGPVDGVQQTGRGERHDQEFTGCAELLRHGEAGPPVTAWA